MALNDLIAEYHMETSSFAKRVDEIFEQALAAPVQEPYCFFYVENGEEYFAPKGAYVPDNAQPLYTTQPAARQWVRLTDEDKLTVRSMPWETLGGLMDNIEAKLKEKNHG